MSLRINQNVLSIKTYGTLTQNSDRLEKSIEKLSSGLRINRAADDAAGLAISEKLRRQVRGLSRAVLNAQDGISMIQAGEGALNESHSILQRMRELAVQSGNDTLTSNDRLEIQKEVTQLRDDLNRISRNTEFNTKKLLDGSQSALISSSSRAIRGLVTGQTDGGGDFDVSIAMISGGVSQVQRSQIFTLKDNGSTLAGGTTQLQSIGQMYDQNGIFILENPQSVTVTGNSKSVSITLDGQMTLDKLASAIQNALASVGGLGMSNSQAGVVNTTLTNVAGLGGYIQLTTGNIGKTGDVAFAGDQGLLNSLGMTVTRESKNNLVELTLRDANGNLRTTRTESDRATGLLDGIDIQFSSQAGQIAGTQGLETGLYVSTDQTFTISAGGVSVAITVDTGSWTLEGISRSINQQISAAAISGLSSSIFDGQIRITMEPTAATIASTINLSGATAAGTVGLNNGAFSGFTQGTKDTSKAVVGFTQYVTSGAATITFSVADSVNAASVSGFATLTTVSTADMVRFTDFQATANDQLRAASVAVRVYEAGMAFSFTSTRVGQENPNGANAILSKVTVNQANNDILTKFGMTNGTSSGSGDKNFRVHVVDNKPLFQIGADQGQAMQVSMGNMSAEALGVDNLDMTSIQASERALGKINQAIDKVSSERSKLGAFQNRMEYAINNLRNTQSNLTSAESRIRDADIAQEMIEFTRNQIVQQSGTAMLAQANLVPQGVLQLLR